MFVEVKDGSNVFPLYLYPSDALSANLLPDHQPSDAPGGRHPNLAPEFIAGFSSKLGMSFVGDGKGDRLSTFGPEDVFSYMYAVFHSPEYRRRYAEFLKIDFPRLPITGNPVLFRELRALGDRLVSLHLMEGTGSNPPGFPEKGSDIVDEVRYQPPSPQCANGRVWINSAQYFDGVPPEVWEFHIGGYQVCQKWLKDRRGRQLDYDDLDHYSRTVAALGDTIHLMAEIDRTIADHGGFPIG